MPNTEGTMMKYFWGDSIQRWAFRLGLFGLSPVALSSGFSWYAHGLSGQTLLRLKVLSILTLLSAVFLLIAHLKGKHLSKGQLKKLRKN